MKGRPSYAYSERLMKKMGWTEGKGLGKNENGSPDFIRPKIKVNTKGIGFTGVDDRWIEHQEAFDSLLSNLNDGNPAAKEDKLISVEERAFKLGGRVHYSKFLRGKDLSQKKEEDLNAIVVKRKNKKDLESVQRADTTGQEDLSGVKTHTSSMSYQEYFAQRMKASKRRRGLEDGDSQSCEKNGESGGEDSERKSVKKSKRYEKDTYAQNEWTSCTSEDMVGTGLALNGVYAENAGSFQDGNVQHKKKKKKSKDKSDDGSRSQCSEMSVEQREERLMEDPAEVATMPDESCWEGVVSKRQIKPKHADDSEQTLLEATASRTELYSEDGVSRQVKRKSRHKSCDSGKSEGLETVTSSAEWALEEDVPRRQKKSKRTAENEAVFKQHGQLKKLKRDLADEDEQIEQEDHSQVRERGTSKAAVLDANAEELPKDCELRKPKRKQEEKEKKGVAKLNAKADAREGSSQQQQVVSKKCEQEQEQNDEYENQIGGARVKTKTVPKQKPKEDASFGDGNPQQEQTNQNTKGNKRPKQGLEDIAAPKKRHSEEEVVQTSNIPLKKQKEGKKSSGSKLKQNEGTRTKPVVKKHVKDASKLVAENSEATATRPVSEEPVLSLRPTSVPGNLQRLGYSMNNTSADSHMLPDCTRTAERDSIPARKRISKKNTRAGNAASSHSKGPHPRPIACSLDKLEKGIWMHYFEPNFNVQAIDDATAASMAQWVVDTVENSGSKMTPYKACHLDKETYATVLSNHLSRRHSTSNWMQIPGYGSDSWVQGIINNLVSKLLVKRQKDAS